MGDTQTFKEHIDDLVKIGKKNIVAFFILLVINFFVAQRFLEYIASRYSIAALRPGDSLTALITIDISLSVIMLFPFLLITIVNYIKPAIQNKKYLRNIIVFSLTSFIIGGIFGYFVYAPSILYYLEGLSTSFGIANVWGVSYIVTLLFTSILIFGFSFQIPIIVYVLLRNKWVKPNLLFKLSLVFVPLVLLIAGWITPPDVLSLLMLSAPIIFLYYLGIIISIISQKNWRRKNVRSD